VSHVTLAQGVEAQRLGLRAYGSDLNPVAVLIGKALVEIPPKFADLPPVNPDAQTELARGGRWNGKRAQGLAEDVRYYGRWMRDEAERRIGHLYPKAQLPDGSEATVIAWLWARTVRSPDPAAKGAMVPLVSSFMLSTKEGKKTWVEPRIDTAASEGWRFELRTGALSKSDEERLKKGTKTGRGANFTCVLTGSPLDGDYVKAEGMAGHMGVRLMAVVAEGERSRTYLSPDRHHEATAAMARPHWAPEGDLPNDPRNFWTVQYGLKTFASLFTSRQLTALTTFSDLVAEVREQVLADTLGVEVRGSSEIETAAACDALLSEGGSGRSAYADAVATYLACALSRSVDRGSSICSWDSSPKMEALRNTFARQALPMTWDFAEGNPLSASSGNFTFNVEWTADALSRTPALSVGSIANINAAKNSFPVRSIMVSTDPPYYDNIGYADLSDFFYVWLKRSLMFIWPELFRRLVTPKTEELVATPYRHGGRHAAEAFFMNGMGQALSAIRNAATDDVPLTIYYAFKQAESADDGITSAGWASFLQAIVNTGLVIDGTWPIRTELTNRMVGRDANALASSVVLVCRKRRENAAIITRADLVRNLKRELPQAIDDIRKAGVGPVDMQQSVIGPGMGIFSRNARVLEDDDQAMCVKTALALINRVWEEIENELDTAFDAETQVALAWYGSYGFDGRASGELITLTTAKNTSDHALFSSGVFKDMRGKTCLTPREDLPPDWTPVGDRHLTVWECVQHTARMLDAKNEQGGAEAAARLVAQMGPLSADARKLAYRLFEIATKKGWSAEALVYNELAEIWPKLEDLASNTNSMATSSPQYGLI
jgi:putative DNA methylase